jgi:hypothetical protein
LVILFTVSLSAVSEQQQPLSNYKAGFRQDIKINGNKVKHALPGHNKEGNEIQNHQSLLAYLLHCKLLSERKYEEVCKRLSKMAKISFPN